jgi:RNA polymerase sigma-70 factor (ECF subfamily)
LAFLHVTYAEEADDPLQQATEQALIRQVLDGDPEPFARIVRQYQNLVASVAYRMGVRAGSIEDVVSEVFMKVYTRLHQYDGRYALSSWIYRIATNHVLDGIRRQRRAGSVALDAVAEPADPRMNVAGEVELSERDRLVRDALRELPDDYQRVLALKHFEDLSVEAIAEALDLPEGTVKIRLMRGRQRLRKILEARHPDHFADRALAAAGSRDRSAQ